VGLLASRGAVADEWFPAFGPNPDEPVREYSIGVHPLHNPVLLHSVFQPLVAYLNRHVSGAHLRLVASRNYRQFDERMSRGAFDFALPNPYQVVRATTQGYTVFGKMGDDADFRGLILVRKDSGLRQTSDLKGKVISYPAPSALAATMMPQFFLQSQGLDVRSETVSKFVGSQESSIMSVYLRLSDAGATWPPPWRQFVRSHPDIAGQLEVRWETPSLVNNGLVAKDTVPPELVRRISELMIGLEQTPEGRDILQRIGVSRFERADEQSYEPVRSFLREFERRMGQGGPS
jgi:phosphonate transport system substrate-binding protein